MEILYNTNLVAMDSNILLGVPLASLDGNFYVWLEYVALRKNASWLTTLLPFFLVFAFRLGLAWLFPTNPGLPSKNVFLPKLLKILHDIHLVAGLNASFSHLGVFYNDNSQVFSSNQAKWRYIALFPLMAIYSIRKPPSYNWFFMVLSVFAILAALIGIQETGESYAATSVEEDNVLPVLCPIAVAFASPIFAVNVTKREGVLAQGAFAILVYALFQYRVGALESKLSLVEHWYTWPLLLASSCMLVQPLVAKSTDKSKGVTHFEAGIQLLVLLMGVMLSASSLLTRYGMECIAALFFAQTHCLFFAGSSSHWCMASARQRFVYGRQCLLQGVFSGK